MLGLLRLGMFERGLEGGFVDGGSLGEARARVGGDMGWG